MKPRAAWITCAVAVLAVVLLCLWPLLGRSWFFVKYADIDLNSGDLRHQVRVCSLVVSTRIEESPLSREVRRLGIPVPANRAWRHAFEGRLVRGVCVDYWYGSVYVQIHTLLSLLDQTKTPDEERRVILTELMTSLQTGDPHVAREQTFILMGDIADKHGLDYFIPEFKAYVDKLRDSRKGR